MKAVGLGGLGAQAALAVLLVVIEVALKPVPAAGVLVVSLPGQDVGGNAIQEPAVVGDDHGAAGEASIEGLLEKRCPELSGGELRRVYLWSAISRNPSVLVLDEPTTGLDETSRAELASYVRNNKLKQLIIIVSHDNELANAAETIVSLDNASHRCANR